MNNEPKTEIYNNIWEWRHNDTNKVVGRKLQIITLLMYPKVKWGDAEIYITNFDLMPMSVSICEQLTKCTMYRLKRWAEQITEKRVMGNMGYFYEGILYKNECCRGYLAYIPKIKCYSSFWNGKNSKEEDSKWLYGVSQSLIGQDTVIKIEKILNDGYGQ